jgi:hypothetical protein
VYALLLVTYAYCTARITDTVVLQLLKTVYAQLCWFPLLPSAACVYVLLSVAYGYCTALITHTVVLLLVTFMHVPMYSLVLHYYCTL